jgi:hypothetical protein
VIVEVIKQFDVAVIEAKDQPPITADCHRPKCHEIALERVESPPRYIDVASIDGAIENR